MSNCEDCEAEVEGEEYRTIDWRGGRIEIEICDVHAREIEQMLNGLAIMNTEGGELDDE